MSRPFHVMVIFLPIMIFFPLSSGLIVHSREAKPFADDRFVLEAMSPKPLRTHPWLDIQYPLEKHSLLPKSRSLVF